MDKFLAWMQEKFAPKMNVINHNIWIVTLKDAINQVMPLIFLGSLFSLLYVPGSIFGWDWWPNFGELYGWTMGLISLAMSFLIPFDFMEKNHMRKSRFIAAVSGVILFCITITPELTASQAVGFGSSVFGAGGMFAAIVTGVITSLIISLFGKFSFFSEDSALPDFIRAWFDQMLPLAVVVLLGWILVINLGIDLYSLVQAAIMPLQSSLETPWGFALFGFICAVFYSMGISAWILTPISTPIQMAAIEANMAGASNIFTTSFNYAYLTIGGAGCTLGLSILLCLSKSRQLKALGKACIVPSIFNINEPLVFGTVVWNPFLMIPMWINTVLARLIAYLFTVVIPFAPIPKILFQLWYCPYPLCTWMAAEGSLQAVLLAIIIFAISIIVWYPFFKAYEKTVMSEEAEETGDSGSATQEA